MEVLFARIGAARLEEELQSIFGDSRRANGGDGTISLQQYLNACLAKDEESLGVLIRIVIVTVGRIIIVVFIVPS